jgi:hypothetical protein
MFAEQRGEHGRRLVVRNGCHPSREVLTSAGAIEVTAPRVNDKRTGPATGERMRFCSAIVPPWARKTPKITEVLPLLYLHGSVLWRFRARAGAGPGLGGRPVGGGDHPAHRVLAGRAARLRGPGPVAGGLRLPVG